MSAHGSSEVRRLHPGLSVRGLFVITGVAIAAYFPYYGLLLERRGLRPDEIGLVLGAMAAARVVVNPLWGHAADARLGRVLTERVAALAAAAAGVALYVAGNAIGAILAVSVMLASFHAAIVPMGDSIALDYLGADNIGDYGQIRLWSSVGFALAAVAFGAVFEVTGVGPMPLVYGAGMVALALWSTTIARDAPGFTDHAGRFGSVGATLRAAPRLVPFLGGVLLVGTAFGAAWSFLPLRIVGRGGGPFLVGFAAAAGAITEVPVMGYTSRLVRRLSLRGIYVLGCVAYAGVFTAWALVRDPLAVSLLNIFEGGGFALLYVGGVVVVGRMVPPELRATGQSLIQMTQFGLGSVLGASIGGFVFGRLGPPALFAGGALLALVAAVVVWVTLRPPAFSRRVGSEDRVGRAR